MFPNALRFFSRQSNLAADDALAQALPDLDGDAKQAALSVLIRRGHLPSQTKIIQAAVEEGGDLWSLVLDNLAGCSPAISSVIRSSNFVNREAIISLLVESGRIEAAPIMSEALRLRCQRTRSLAALALREITAVWLANRHEQTKLEINHATNILASALSQVVESWERHLQIGALEAVSWLGWHLANTLVHKLQQPRTRIAIPLLGLVQSAKHPAQAEFLVCVLGIAELRSAAAKAIGQASSDELRSAILSAMWLLADKEVAKGCRWIKQCDWLVGRMDEVLALKAPVVESALRLVGVSGLPESNKASFFTLCMQDSRLAVQQAAFWQLCENQYEPSSDALRLLVSRRVEPFVFSAKSELYRRGLGPMLPTNPDVNAEAAELEAAKSDDASGLLSGNIEYPDAVDKLKAFYDRDPQLLLRTIRSKLASSGPADRLQGLRVVGQLSLVHELAESIYKLSSDPDNQVRSAVMSLLANLPGPTTNRVLRGALYDPDLRVQANAVEAMDNLNFLDRADATRPLLSSPNGRVRANAVKSLLQLEIGDAAEALLDMLEAESRSQRLSALWVVERLKLHSLFDKLVELSEADPDSKIRRRASRVLSGLGPPFDTLLNRDSGTKRSWPTPAQKGLV